MTDCGQDGSIWDVTYQTNQVTLNLNTLGGPVPEPGTWMLMVLGALGIVVHRRRRR